MPGLDHDVPPWVQRIGCLVIWSLFLIFSLFAISKEFDVNYEGTGRRIAMTPETKSEPTTAVELNLPTHLLTQIDALAAANGKDRSAVIVELLTKELRRGSSAHCAEHRDLGARPGRRALPEPRRGFRSGVLGNSGLRHA